MSTQGKYEYSYWRPAVTVDNVVFHYKKGQLYVLLIKRKAEPFKNYWAFPGGFLEENETLEEAARRELMEEAHIMPIYTDQIGTFSNLNRDPRERVISTAFLHAIAPDTNTIKAGDDASEAEWFPFRELPELAFDHALIYQTAIERIKLSFHYTPIGFILLGKQFTMPDMYKLHATLFQMPIDRRNFQKKFLKLNLIKPVHPEEERPSPRTPRLYRFDEEEFHTLMTKLMKP